MADLNTIMRYIKVRALAERGVGGERTNAQRKVTRMEAENPGIKQQADAVLRAQNGSTEKPQRRQPVNPFPTGNWENIFAFAQQAATYAYNVAQTAVNAQYGTHLATQVSSYTRTTQSGRVIIGLRMEEETYWQAQSMNAAQKEMFRNELHEKLDGQLNEMLNQEEEEAFSRQDDPSW